MKKRIVSMILALSMVLSILPVSAFADAGAGLSSAAEETNSITYSSENEHEDVGKNSETKHQVVKIKIAAGLPKAASGTGWSYDETTGLTITGTGSEDTEYILDGTVSCNVTVKNANNYTVYLLDGTVTGTLLIEASYMYGVYVLGGSYTNVVLNRGTIDGGTYDKLTENEGHVLGGFFRDISGLLEETQQQAHKLNLPKGCTLNGRKETEIYIIKQYSYFGNGNDLELVVESDTSCGAWAVASTGGSVMALPAGTTDYNFTYGSMTIASVSISPDGKTLSASFSALPLSDNAPMELVQILSVNKELRFTSEGLPDLTGMTPVDSLDTDANLHRVYMGNGWAYNCYPNDNRNRSIVQILDQSGKEINFKDLSPAPISCAVQVTNATITDADFGQTGALVLTSGKITGGTYHNANVGINSTNGNGTVEITGGTFDSLYCNSSCTISNAVIQSVDFSTYGNNTYTISDTVLGELPDGIQKLLPAGQQLSTLVVRNGNVTKMNGRTLPLSTNTIYLVGEGSAELTLTTDVLSINDAPVSSYNANTSAEGKVLHITGNNDGAEIFVNKSTDPSDLKPLRITEEGLPDLTGVTAVSMTGEGMTINLYEGLGWKYATKEENGRTRAALYITTPDGNPVDLASGAINENQVPIAVEQISLVNMTVTGIVADGPVNAQNAIIQDGTFQRDVYMDENSTIAGGIFQDIVRAYGTITGGAFNAEVQLNQNSEVTGGVFHDVQLPSYATEKTVIQNATILGSLKTGGDSKAAISNTVSCGYIESKYLAVGQQESKLMMTDGTVDAVNGHAVTADAVYLVGNTAVTITFSKAVTNINGKAVSAYDANAQLSADGKTLTLTAKNDGEPIVVNVAASGKLPFSALKESNFTVSGTPENPIITCDQEGVGKLSLVYVRTYDNKEFDHFPSETEYGSYKVYIRAEEGTLYEGGELLVGEGTRKYQPTSTDFNFDLKNGTASYNGQKYFGDAVPQATLKYSATNDWLTATETVPTEAGTYYVWLVVEYDDYYNGGSEQLPDRYTVVEKLPFEGFTMDDFDIDMDDDGNYTLVCKTADGVGELSTKLECLTGVNKGKTFINREPGEDVYGRYQGSIVAKEGKKYKAGSIVVVEDSIRYTPVVEDFAYDAAKNTVEYKGENYYDADPQMTLLYGTDQSETVPTAPGSYDVYVKVTAGKNYIADAYSDDSYRIYQVGTYTVADSEKLPFEGFTREDFKPIGNGDYTYTLVCTKADGVGELTLEYKGLTGVNKGKTYINRDPDIGAYGRYQVTVTAKEGAKYKPGSIDLGEYTFRYAPKAADFTYDATKNTVTYNTDKNYYDADPDMTLLYGTDQSETVPTAPGSYDVYVRVTADDNYEAVTTGKVGTYDVPEPTKPKYCYYWNTQEGKECEVGAPITLGVDKKEGNNVIWKIEGLAEDAYTITDTGTQIELQFFMPSNDVRVTNHYEPIFYTLTVDGKEERRAFGKEVTFTAPEKEGCTFTGWEVDGVPEGTDTTSETINFTMPASNVTLTPQYEKNTYTLTVDGVNEQRVFDEDVTVIAQPVEGKTFTGWKVTGLPADVDTTKATITFKMPANNVTLTPQYTENTYTLTVNGKPEQRTVGEEVTLTARKLEGFTFNHWEIKAGLAADAVDIKSETITFTMPANDVTISARYDKDSTPDPDPETKTHKLNVLNAQIFLKDGSDVADLTAVRVGTELKAIAYEDTETGVFKYWTGLELTEEQSTARVVYFAMPDHDVNLTAVFVTPTNKLEVTNAQVTLKDGSAVADLTAVPAGTELVATAPERDGYTFTGWTATGLPANANIDGATVTFKMPANKVTLNAKYIANAPKKYTVTMGEEVKDYAVDADVSITAPEKEGYTFTGWKVTGLSADVDTTSETITFKMPANNVTLTPQYTENTSETYTVTMGEEVKDYAVDADVSITAPEKDGYTFTGWEVTGLSADVDTTKATITFKMPANNVTLTPQYTEKDSKTYKLDVSYATITLKDGSAVADLTAVPEGTKLVATADEDTETSVFKSWSCTGLELTKEQSTARVVEFTMPDHDVNLTAVFGVPTKPDDPTPAPGGDSDGGGAIVMVAAVGGAAIGVGAYIAGTTAYLKSVLPEGMAIPANRQQLAVALWTAAGKPATQSTALFNDVAADAAELQAIRWVVETGLMTAQDGNFKPGSRVGRMEVIRVWKAYQQRG